MYHPWAWTGTAKARVIITVIATVCHLFIISLPEK